MNSWKHLLCMIVGITALLPTAGYALTSPAELEKSQVKADEMDAALARIKQNNPKRYLRILDMQRKSPDRYNRLTEQVLREYQKLQRLQRIVPANVSLQEEMWKNRTRLTEIMRNIRNAEEGPGRVIMISQMEKVLQSQFDLRMQMKRNRLNRAEAVLGRKLDQLKAEAGRSQEFVGRWKDRLLARIESSSDRSRSRTAAPKRK